MPRLTEFKQDNFFNQKTWKIFLLPKSGIKAAYITCPICGRTAVIDGKIINDDGKITKAFSCPYKNCEYEKDIKLLGWEDWL